MIFDDLRPPRGAVRSRKRVGRGAGTGLGKTAGRGSKGQKSRSGASQSPLFQGGTMPFIRKIPKLGFVSSKNKDLVVVTLDQLNRFDDETEVTLDLLIKARMISKKYRRVKYIYKDGLKKKLFVKGHAFSAKAKDSIVSLGGKFTIEGVV